MTDLAPLVGFGDPDAPGNFAFFHVQRDRNGMYGDWEASLQSSTRQIAGTNDYETQFMGFGPSRLTLTLWFDDRRAYARFHARYGITGTLSLLARFTSHEGIIRTHPGGDYEQFRDTALVDIRDVVHHVDERVECTATFERRTPEVPA